LKTSPPSLVLRLSQYTITVRDSARSLTKRAQTEEESKGVKESEGKSQPVCEVKCKFSRKEAVKTSESTEDIGEHRKQKEEKRKRKEQ
jgi:hypothetical protein